MACAAIQMSFEGMSEPVLLSSAEIRPKSSAVVKPTGTTVTRLSARNSFNLLKLSSRLEPWKNP